MTRIIKKPLGLVVMDGWGYREAREGNAVAQAVKPYYDELLEKYPHTLIEASGTRVGLPAGVMGNSNVGHLNLGAGRVIRTDVGRIDHQIETGEFYRNEVLINAMDEAQRNDRAVHLIGLLSDGLVHSSNEHLYALLRLAKMGNIERVFIHCFLDGRDTAPSGGQDYLRQLQTKCEEIRCGKIASVIGRYYAMDRDQRWERTQLAYNLLTDAQGERTTDPIGVVRRSYERNVTDEFVMPIVVTDDTGAPVATVQSGDSVIFFNFRADRARQLSRALAVPEFNGFVIKDRPLVSLTTFTQYERDLPFPYAFETLHHKNILADVFAAREMINLRLAETEKYAHVTYFFNGGTEKPFDCENRLLVQSPKVATYDLEPAMSAYKITDKVLRAVDEAETDVFIINFANADMVGHTGNLQKTIEAVQHVDTCLGWITKSFRRARGRLLITSDHGNCEVMINPQTGEPHTAHTSNPVPFILMDEAARGAKLREGGALEDVAPTMLALLGLDKPDEMTGRDLRSE